MEWWQIAAGANGVIALAYLGISAAVLLPLVEAGQLRSNRLGLATALIFFSCAVGHGGHALHLLLPAVGLDTAHGEMARGAVDWHLTTADIASATVGVWYWTLRRSYGRLLQGASLFEDLAVRQRRAAEINDTVVQGIVTAQLARRLGRDDEADAALEGTLVAARELVSGLLDDAAGGRKPDAGDFVRRTAATVGVDAAQARPAPAPRQGQSPEHSSRPGT